MISMATVNGESPPTYPPIEEVNLVESILDMLFEDFLDLWEVPVANDLLVCKLGARECQGLVTNLESVLVKREVGQTRADISEGLISSLELDICHPLVRYFWGDVEENLERFLDLIYWKRADVVDLGCHS